MHEVDVSVLVPVLNEERHLRDAVESMRRQRLDGNAEFLFIDGGSEDASRSILEGLSRSDPRIRVFDNPHRTTPVGLNIGLRNARGRFVARMDAHTRYPADYLQQGMERLDRGDVVWVGGPQLPHGTGRWSRRVSIATRSWAGLGGGAAFRLGAAHEIETDTLFTGMWRRSTVEELGGWDEGWPANQDVELAGRIRSAGGRIVCLPEMGAEYIPRDSLKALGRQYFRYGFYRAKTAKRHPHTLRRSHVLCPGVVLAAGASIVAPRPLARLARFGMASYALALVAASAREATPGQRKDAATLPAVFATMHLSWGAGFLAGAARFGPPFAGLIKAFGPKR